MMFGSPLPVGILNRSYGSNGEVRTISGRPEVADIEFLPTGIGFKALSPGKFIAIFSTETLRQELSVAISSPSAAAIARNSNEWKRLSFEQIMTIAFTPNPSTAKWNVSSHTKQTRTFMPFEHVSHSWLCDLATNENGVLDLTIADATNLKWMLAVMRVAGPTLESRNANIYTNDFPTQTPSAGVTSERMGNIENVRRWIIQSTSNGGTLNMQCARPRTSTAYTARVQLLRMQTVPSYGVSIAGTVGVEILKDAISLGSTTMTIPLDGFQVWELPIASSVFTGTEFLNLRFTGIDSSEKFELEFSLDAV